jgi:hypothetical protein
MTIYGLFLDESQSVPGASGPAGAADAVDVVFVGLGL